MVKDTIITVSGKTYEVNVKNLEDFFEQCAKLLAVNDLEDLDLKLEDIQDLIVSNASGNDTVNTIKDSYILIRELKILFGFGFMVKGR